MKGKGRITAFERDRKRFQTLEMMVKKAGAANVRIKNQDFLSVDPFDPEYAKVSHMYVVPDTVYLPLMTISKSTGSLMLWIWDCQPVGLPLESRFARLLLTCFTSDIEP